MIPQETEPKLSASVGGSPVEAWVGRGSPQGWGYWQQQSGKAPLGIILLDVAIKPTMGLIEPRAVSSQARELPEKECSPTHQQIIGLQLY